jgi:putative ABC transport system permease protein
MTIAQRLYRSLAEAFPHEFKLAYGEEMLEDGEAAMEHIARQRGLWGLLPLLADLAMRLPVEYLSEMRQDLRYAARALVKSPGYAVVAIVSMGLGIGLTTNVYSSGWSLLTRQLPGVENASHLVTPEKPVSFYYIEQYREERSLFNGVAAVETPVQFNVGLGRGPGTKPQRVFGQIVSPDYFLVLGMHEQRGRLLNAQEDKPGEAPVVISDRFWRSRLNADQDVVGQTIRVNGQNATIVGVTPKKFDGALSPNPVEMFVPTTAPATMVPELGNDVLEQRNAKVFAALMCLKPRVTIDQAEAALDGITRRLDKLDPMAPPQTAKGKRVALAGAGTRVPIPRQFKPALIGFYIVLMAAVTAIACLNLATMLLARGANRRRELAIRLAVGASRFRLMRQMVSEGILVSLVGGGAGLALAYGLWMLNAHAKLPAGAPLNPEVALDLHAVLFALALSVVCGIGFSAMPAFPATKTDVATALKEGAALQLSGHKRFGLRNLAMGAQVAGSLMLLLVTGFLVLGIMRSNSLQTNFDQRTMVFLSIDPVRDGYSPAKARAFFEALPQRLSASGKVQNFALAAHAPFLTTDDQDDHSLTAEESHAQSGAAEEKVGAGYFAAISEPLLAGREFDERDEGIQTDGTDAGNVALPVVLNEKSARVLFGSGSAIGKRLRDDQHEYEVIGVVPSMKDAMGITRPTVYLPLSQPDFSQPPAGGITIIARGHSATDALVGVRSVLTSMDPNLTVFNVETLGEFLELTRAQMRHALRTFGGIGLFGLILSAVGLAGVTAYAVAQRRKEIGIRMALGASKSQVLGLVLREGLALIAAGTVIGFLGAVAVTKLVSAIMKEFADAFEIGTSDPRLLLGAPLLLAGLALLACWIPARRAAQIDPLEALRQE